MLEGLRGPEEIGGDKGLIGAGLVLFEKTAQDKSTARVVSLSSRGHQFAGIDFDDPQFQHRSFDKYVAYGQAKTANALFAVELDRRGKTGGVRAYAVHPGAVLTGLIRDMTEDELLGWGISLSDRHGSAPVGKSVDEGGEFKTLEQGTATSVWCATSPQLAGMGGVYCQDADIAGVLPPDSTSHVGVRSYAIDPAAAVRLWALSESLTGVKI